MALQRLHSWVDAFEGAPRKLRISALISAHLILFSLAYSCAFLLRFDLTLPPDLLYPALFSLPLFLTVKALIFASLKLFQGWWKYVSLYDIITLSFALALSSILILALHALLPLPHFPRSIYLLDFLLSLLLVASTRGGLRLLREALASYSSPSHLSEPLLIVGASDPADLLIREISRTESLRYRPVALLDDDPNKLGLRLHGLPIEGPIDSLPDIARKHSAKALIIALQHDDPPRVRRIVELALSIGIQPRILPPFSSVLDGSLDLTQIREVSLDDLLGRDPVQLDLDSLGRFLKDRCILITGAGGSIGSELSRQVARFHPGHLLLLDSAETPLFHIHRELSPLLPHITPLIGDVSDALRVHEIFQQFSPDIVLHAAAYKHVPLMESHPCDAVINNVQGTRLLADAAAQHRVSTFLLISTDKAVNPTSIMGATKRSAELYLHHLTPLHPHTRFCSVRFGNVLGSNGSVVPIFRQQIKAGGPVTVTHPDMTRYFMTIPEAVQLVLQAAAFETDDSLFILDMGQPVRIASLAQDMIRLSGRSEDEIPIIYTGIRPGEKLFEELSLDTEDLRRTAHHMIFVGEPPDHMPPSFLPSFDHLLAAAHARDAPRVLSLLQEIIPEFHSPHHPNHLDPPLRIAPG